ncbi:MAG: hypothetical protein J6Y53_02495 [Alphaproteobacteria bacterium]|nr:hypothetical protein [Alphaproteobacteria bacterium]
MSTIVPPLAVSSSEKYVDGETYTRYEYADNSYGIEDKKDDTLRIYHPDGSWDVYKKKKGSSNDYAVMEKFSKDGTFSTTLDVSDEEINKKVKERAHWLCQQYIEANNRRLKEIKSLDKNGKNKYVRDMFERIGHGRMYANYCITAQLNCLQDVCDASGNLNGSYCKDTNCANFISNMKKNGYADCFTNNPKKEDIHPGDMIFTPRGGGNYHVVSVKEVYIDKYGKRQIVVNGFNHDNCYKFDGGNCVVFNTEKYIEKALWKELEQQNFMQQEDNITSNDGSRQMNDAQYAEMNEYLTRGMPTAGDTQRDDDMLALYDIEPTAQATQTESQPKTENEDQVQNLSREEIIISPHRERSLTSEINPPELSAEEHYDNGNTEYHKAGTDKDQAYIIPPAGKNRETVREKLARLRQERAERYQNRREELRAMRATRQNQNETTPLSQYQEQQAQEKKEKLSLFAMWKKRKMQNG